MMFLAVTALLSLQPVSGTLLSSQGTSHHAASVVTSLRFKNQEIGRWCQYALGVEEKRESTFNIALTSKAGPVVVLKEAEHEEHKYHNKLQETCEAARFVLDEVSTKYMPQLVQALDEPKPKRSSEFLAPSEKPANPRALSTEKSQPQLSESATEEQESDDEDERIQKDYETTFKKAEKLERSDKEPKLQNDPPFTSSDLDDEDNQIQKEYEATFKKAEKLQQLNDEESAKKNIQMQDEHDEKSTQQHVQKRSEEEDDDDDEDDDHKVQTKSVKAEKPQQHREEDDDKDDDETQTKTVKPAMLQKSVENKDDEDTDEDREDNDKQEGHDADEQDERPSHANHESTGAPQVSFLQIGLTRLLSVESVSDLPHDEAKRWCSFFMSAHDEDVPPVAEAKNKASDAKIKLAAYTVNEESVVEEIRVRSSVRTSWEEDLSHIDPVITELKDGEETMRSEAEMAPGTSNTDLALSVIQKIEKAHESIIGKLKELRAERRAGIKRFMQELGHLDTKRNEMAVERRQNQEAVQLADMRLKQSQTKIQQIQKHCKDLDNQKSMGIRRDW